VIGVPATRITKTLDLFILGEYDDCYVLWMIDLEYSGKTTWYVCYQDEGDEMIWSN